MIASIAMSNRLRAGVICAACAFAVADWFAFASAGDAEPLDQPSSGRSASGCDAFAWPVSNERAWFANGKLRRSVSGARLSRIDRAVELTLMPTKSIQFFLPPEQVFGVPHPGIYQVTVSRDAWIEMFENGRRLPFVGASEAKDCDGVRKSERFALAPGDLVLVQISGASQPSIEVAFEKAPDSAGRVGRASAP
jgi:hypothetical protein